MKVRVIGMLREIVGKNEIGISLERELNITDLFKMLSFEYGERFKDYIFEPKTNEIRRSLVFLLNERRVDPLRYADTIIRNNDKLTIFPMSSGGYNLSIGTRQKRNKKVHKDERLQGT